MGKYELGNVLAILAAARNAQWDEPTGYTGAPASASAGVYCENSLEALVVVKLREEAHRRTARITIAALDLTANYVVTVDGHVVNYDALADGAATEQDVIDGIAAAIIADGPASSVVTASAEDASTVLLVGVSDDDYTLVLAANGAAVLAGVADATTAQMRVWVTVKSGNDNTPGGWVKPSDADFTIDRCGFLERFGVASLDRLYIELSAVDGAGDSANVTYAPTVRIGPCVTE